MASVRSSGSGRWRRDDGPGGQPGEIRPPIRRPKAWWGIDVYFADPYSPWQRPTNENGNSLLRHYVGKGTDLRAHADADLRAIEHRINIIPRRSLHWSTAADVHHAAVTMTGWTRRDIAVASATATTPPLGCDPPPGVLVAHVDAADTVYALSGPPNCTLTFRPDPKRH